tara:strand:+ start:73 stop:198 length:126 start_codon:yes stop_codon:yes gene_type:complete
MIFGIINLGISIVKIAIYVALAPVIVAGVVILASLEGGGFE